VEIAHVAYVHGGRCKILFDAGQDLGARTRGVDVPGDFYFNPLLGVERRNAASDPVTRGADTEFWGFERSSGLSVSAGGPAYVLYMPLGCQRLIKRVIVLS
jgi:hypothetical protein